LFGSRLFGVVKLTAAASGDAGFGLGLLIGP
jgi:hypothetical protein